MSPSIPKGQGRRNSCVHEDGFPPSGVEITIRDLGGSTWSPPHLAGCKDLKQDPEREEIIRTILEVPNPKEKETFALCTALVAGLAMAHCCLLPLLRQRRLSPLTPSALKWKWSSLLSCITSGYLSSLAPSLLCQVMHLI